LWPVGLIALFFYLIAPLLGHTRHILRQRRGASDSYSFEFAFRMNEPTTPKLVHDFIRGRRRRRLRGGAYKRRLILRVGGGRMERVSLDTTLMMVHAVAVARVGFLRFARFEIVNEVLARRIADNYQYFVRQCRIFGDSPRALGPQEIRHLVADILDGACRPLAHDTDIGLNVMMALADPIYFGQNVGEPTRTDDEDDYEIDDVVPPAAPAPEFDLSARR